jgi:hypothetical protein
MLRRILSSVAKAFRNPDIRQLLAWCLPALLAGFMVRAALTWQLPFGHYHSDTPDFLTTPDRLLFDHRFELHTKKTFLAPVFFTLPFLLHVPALIAIPAVQHLLGLGLVVLIGLICRLWFVHWKWFIVPLTLIAALHPALLWFEHTLMAETIFLFCTVLLAVAGTLYARQQKPPRFVLLCVALVLEAGARPEGKLLLGFGILLIILVHRRDYRRRLPQLAAILLLAVALHFLTRTSQAGLLLYTSVARLTPPDLAAAPGFESYVAEERATLQRRWDEMRLFPKVADRRVIAGAVEQYLMDQRTTALPNHRHSVNDFCAKLAAETCLRQFCRLPEHVYWKFRYTATEAPNGLLDQKWLWDAQDGAYADQADRALRLSRGLTGRSMTSVEEWEEFVREHYREVRWFNAWSAGWFGLVNAWRLPDTGFESRAFAPGTVIYRGLPIYFLLGGAGLIVIALRRGPLRPFHIAWGLTLAAFFFAIILTANVKPRFRFVFEPFWFLYIALLVESLVLGIAGFRSSRTARNSDVC